MVVMPDCATVWFVPPKFTEVILFGVSRLGVSTLAEVTIPFTVPVITLPVTVSPIATLAESFLATGAVSVIVICTCVQPDSSVPSDAL